MATKRRYRPQATLPGEVWLPIPTLEAYEASSLGRIRSLARISRRRWRSGAALHDFHVEGRVLTSTVASSGYELVSVAGRLELVHRLVALAFLAEPDAFTPQVNHRDGNKRNNHPWNLEWANSSEQVKHALRLGLAKRKLNLDGAAELRSLAAAGVGIGDLACRFGICKTHASRVVAGKFWNWG